MRERRSASLAKRGAQRYMDRPGSRFRWICEVLSYDAEQIVPRILGVLTGAERDLRRIMAREKRKAAP